MLMLATVVGLPRRAPDLSQITPPLEKNVLYLSIYFKLLFLHHPFETALQHNLILSSFYIIEVLKSATKS